MVLSVSTFLGYKLFSLLSRSVENRVVKDLVDNDGVVVREIFQYL